MPPFPTVGPIYEFRHDGGFIISEARGMRSRDVAMIAEAGYRIVAGTVMGKIAGYTGQVTASAGNTGNPTFSAVTTKAGVQPGVYTIICTAATSAAVNDPYGNLVGTLTFGSAFNNQIGITITAGSTACVAGDTFFVSIQPLGGTGYAEIVAAAGNTGNPTFSGVTIGTGAQDGTYILVCTDATHCTIYDPYGNQVGSASALTFGSAYSGQFGVTITAGSTACVVGDTFYVFVSTARSVVGKIWANTNNTGNPTFSAVVPEASVKAGVYPIVCTAATTATVYDPEGNVVGTLTFGSGFSTQIGVTITAGSTACVAGDTFYVQITPELYVGAWLPFNPTATDGSDVPAGILFGMVDVTHGGFYGTIMVRDCEVNTSELMWGSGVTTLVQQQEALATLQAQSNIIGRPGIGGLVTGTTPVTPFAGTTGAY